MHKNKRILIAGDSFSSIQLSGSHGWPALLQKNFCITNTSFPGIGEYKILQKLQAAELHNYDLILVSHTSPNRLYCTNNPLYPIDHMYSQSDIIFADAESRAAQVPLAASIIDYYKYIFDTDYYKFIHTCCCEKINQLTQSVPALHITHFDWTGLYQFDNMINFHTFWLANRGNFVHYTEEANQIVYEQLRNRIQEMLS
jgi:hypothetical protein